MKYKKNILELIGNTPLVELHKVNEGLKPRIFAKLESSNPGGSVKDRISLAMIEAAEKSGELKPGGTIVEATSGNTGIGLALVAAVKGYKSVFVVTDKVSDEKINYLKALGTEVIVVSNAAEPDDSEYYVNVAKRISEETPNSIFAYQYSNPANPEAHYKTTGPEIWEQTDGKITHFVASIGTGGTISGAGRYLKEKNQAIKVIGADPLGSILKTYKETGKIIHGTPYLVEGIGQDCLPENVHFQYIDKIINISDKDSFAAARRLTKEEGIFCGGSTGTILNVVLKIAEDLTENDVIVFIVCDTGERYLSKLHNHNWLVENKMIETDIKTLRDISYRKKAKGFEEIICVHDDDTVKDAVELLAERGVTQLVVFNHEREPVGSIIEEKLMTEIVNDKSILNNKISSVMEENFPFVDAKVSLNEVRKLLENNSAILVQDFGRVTDIITKYDLIDFN
ncbi:putative cystathionine beta-synthase [bacterium BMS3Abin04]|nr:putative cystathionine beta-synthase [bacterium BMS3Abin04]